jgi:hypothetical protein
VLDNGSRTETPYRSILHPFCVLHSSVFFLSFLSTFPHFIPSSRPFLIAFLSSFLYSFIAFLCLFLMPLLVIISSPRVYVNCSFCLAPLSAFICFFMRFFSLFPSFLVIGPSYSSPSLRLRLGTRPYASAPGAPWQI